MASRNIQDARFDAHEEEMARQYIEHRPDHRGCSFQGPEGYAAIARRLLREQGCAGPRSTASRHRPKP